MVLSVNQPMGITCAILLILILFVKHLQSDYILDVLNINILDKAPKIWHKYVEKEASKSLEKTILNLGMFIPHIKLLSAHAEKTKQFYTYANRDTPSPLSSQDLPTTKCSAKFYHTNLRQPEHKRWFVVYKSSVLKQLHFNLSIFHLSTGVAAWSENCDFMFISVQLNSECLKCAHEKLQYKYCGQHSNFNLYPDSNAVCIVLSLAFTGLDFHGLVQVFDSTTFSTLTNRRYSDTDFSSVCVVPSLKSFLYVGFICVEKHKIISFNLKAANFIENITALFDGPDFQSKQL